MTDTALALLIPALALVLILSFCAILKFRKLRELAAEEHALRRSGASVTLGAEPPPLPKPPGEAL